MSDDQQFFAVLEIRKDFWLLQSATACEPTIVTGHFYIMFPFFSNEIHIFPGEKPPFPGWTPPTHSHRSLCRRFHGTSKLTCTAVEAPGEAPSSPARPSELMTWWSATRKWWLYVLILKVTWVTWWYQMEFHDQKWRYMVPEIHGKMVVIPVLYQKMVKNGVTGIQWNENGTTQNGKFMVNNGDLTEWTLEI